MNNSILKLYVKMQSLQAVLKGENGQDMVEYGLVLGLIALGATAAISGLSTTIATAFANIGAKLTTYTS
jgi:pilus assembly protein Flp/PilA